MVEREQFEQLGKNKLIIASLNNSESKKGTKTQGNGGI